jgi:predicted GIY-YIG superfamily endonuclease
MQKHSEKDFDVVMTASRLRGVIYTGLTSDLSGRTWEHRARVVDGFTKRDWADRLVHFEPHDNADVAQRRSDPGSRTESLLFFLAPSGRLARERSQERARRGQLSIWSNVIGYHRMVKIGDCPRRSTCR